MYTIKYKEGFINGYCDRKECSIVFKGIKVKCKTIIGAKRLISKIMNWPNKDPEYIKLALLSHSI